MTDQELHDLLHASVPEPPDLTGLAGRAETSGRARRARRRGGVVALAAVATAVAVSGAVVVLRLGGNDLPSAHRSPSPRPSVTPTSTTPAAQQCVSTKALDHPDLTKGTAVWARFCPVDAGAAAAYVPDTTLVSGVGDLVKGWQDRAGGYFHSCPYVLGSTTFAVQIGFADGTTAEVDGETGACQAAVTPGNQPVEGSREIFSGLIHAMGEQSDAGTTHQRELSCPPRAQAPGQPGSLAQLSATAVVGGRLCRTSYGTSNPALTRAQAEQLRISLLGGWSPRRTPPCGPYSRDVLALLRDRLGRIYEITFDARHCGLVSVGSTQIGYAGQVLVNLLSWRR